MREKLAKWLGNDVVKKAYERGQKLAMMPQADAYAILILGVVGHIDGLEANPVVETPVESETVVPVEQETEPEVVEQEVPVEPDVPAVSEPEVLELEPEVPTVKLVADSDFGDKVKGALAEAGILTAEDVLSREEELEGLSYIGKQKKARLLEWAKG